MDSFNDTAVFERIVVHDTRKTSSQVFEVHCNQELKNINIFFVSVYFKLLMVDFGGEWVDSDAQETGSRLKRAEVYIKDIDAGTLEKSKMIEIVVGDFVLVKKIMSALKFSAFECQFLEML